MSALQFPSPQRAPELEVLRIRVRAFLAAEIGDRSAVHRSDSWNGLDTDFSRKLGVQGWIGMTWPTEFGGGGHSAFERYTVIEELLAAGAPVAAHWIADRQSGPLLLRFGSARQKAEILPRIARGECYFCIGMSEPGSGSDLASVRTRATPVAGGYRITGTKLWTTNAHIAHYMILFCRTSGTAEDRHRGHSQFLVDLTLPGIEIRPIIDMAGQHHFNEVIFDDLFVPTSALIGQEGQGWEQVTSELALERSGPERFLSSFELLVQLSACLGPDATNGQAMAFGRLMAHLAILRRLSLGVAQLLETGTDPLQHAAMVKDLGATFEQDLPEIARLVVDAAPGDPKTVDFCAVLANLTLNAPTFSLRGGTREILRGIIARGLGLR
jgi:alkylation response protein AidB-like acyl-CoA dehydrogenase